MLLVLEREVLAAEVRFTGTSNGDQTQIVALRGLLPVRERLLQDFEEGDKKRDVRPGCLSDTTQS